MRECVCWEVIIVTQTFKTKKGEGEGRLQLQSGGRRQTSKKEKVVHLFIHFQRQT